MELNMSSLMEFLQNQDVGVTSAGHALHISHALAHTLVTMAEGLEVAMPTFVGLEGGSAIGAATIGGIAIAYIGPILGLSGAFMALGSGYHDARREIQNEAIASAFSQGFVAGILNMSPTTTRSLFGVHGIVHVNVMDPESDSLRVNAHNRGLLAGYAFANTASAEQKKSFVFELRRFTGDVPHSRWDDLEKRNYVLEYAAKLRLHYLNHIE
jgi:hypothetical protein